MQPEDVETFRLAAWNSHAPGRLRARTGTEIEPRVRDRVDAELTRKTRRAMLARKRAQARRLEAGSNRPPRNDPVHVTATGRAAQPPKGPRLVVRPRGGCLASAGRSRGQWEAAGALLAELDPPTGDRKALREALRGNSAFPLSPYWRSTGLSEPASK